MAKKGSRSAPKYTTKAPSGLDIKREGNRFVLSWKAQDKDIEYQEMKYWCYDDTNVIKKTWKNGNINSFTTEVVDNFVGKITLPYVLLGNTGFYLRTGFYHKIVFYVRQRRADFQETYKVEEGKGKNKKTVTYEYKNKTNPGISNWVKKEWIFEKPNAPELEWSVGEDDGDTIFKWDFRNKRDNDRKAAFKFLTQTLFLRESNVTDGAKLYWGAAPLKLYGTANDREIEHSGHVTESTTSYTQWFRCKVLGGGVESPWKYDKRVFAFPNRASNVKGEAKVLDSNNLVILAKWNTSQSNARPCEKAVLQYAFAVPVYTNGELVTPPNVTWQNSPKVNQVRPNDDIRVNVSGGFEADQCLFVRVNTWHDNYETLGFGTLIRKGRLADPDEPTLSNRDVSNRQITVTSTNRSQVDGSFLAVYFHSDTNLQNRIIGIIPAGSTSVTVKYPDDKDATEIAFGVKAMVGTYAAKTNADGVTTYTIDAIFSGDSIIWKESTVPLPPTGVKATPISGKDNTVKVEWNWSWKDANKAEISWADSDDAWESTDAPDTFIISTRDRNHVYVKNIEVGKQWYFSVRLMKETDDETLESEWSDPIAVDLALAPQRPSLVLSRNTVVVDGETTASWSYVSVDGTIQAHAEICEVEMTQNGALYGRIVAQATTAKHATIRANDTVGEQLYAVRTTSASGKESEWSDPVALRTVAPISVKIGELPNNYLGSTEIVTYGYETEMANNISVADESALIGFFENNAYANDDTLSVERRAGVPQRAASLNGYYYLPSPSTTMTLSRSDWLDYGTLDGEHMFEHASAEDITFHIRLSDLYGGEWYFDANAEEGHEGYNIVFYNSGTKYYIGELLIANDYSFSQISLDTEAMFETLGLTPYEAFYDIEINVVSEQTITIKRNYAEDVASSPEDIGLLIDYTFSVAKATYRVVRTVEYEYDYEGDDLVFMNLIRDLPYTVPITTTGVMNSVTAHLERLGSYYAPYPDENTIIGYDKEIVLSKTINGQPESIVFDNDDKLSSIDDGAFYDLVVTGRDGIGQVAEDRVSVLVRWNDQAKLPSAVIEIDEDADFVKITPSADGAVEGSTCDIYRLSVDKPELIIKDGVWGETYVDPFPALGEFGGHRIVYKTKNGDYIMQDGNPAWIDTGINEDDYISPEHTIIEFGGDKIYLDRNVDVDSAWQKDFIETKYLGGSVQGDWNSAVSRTGTINAVAITLVDKYEIKAMRRLAVWSGICHVRTPDGSSFNANVNVAENRPHDVYGTRATFTLNVTRVDQQEIEGMTLQEWNDQHGVE